MSLSPALRRLLRRFAVAVGLVLILAAGVLIGGHPSWLPSPLRSVFVSETQNERLSQDVLGLIAKDYYRPVNTTRLLNDGLEQAVASLKDPYSHYYPPALYHSFENDLDSQISGIGIDLSSEPVDGGYEIEEVIRHTPAAKAGLQQGEIIVAVNGKALAALNPTQTAELIRGRAGTTVTLALKHGKRRSSVKVVRATIVVPVVSSKLVHSGGKTLGYIAFTQFAQGSAAELRADVKELLARGAQGLILDLRDNPGGYLTQAVAVASTFISHGTIVTTRGRSVGTNVYQALGNAIAPTIPLVVIVDRGTASSAEIVTGALKDHHRALVIGTHTYGKGVFQEIQPIPGGGALDITVGEYFTPNGENLGAGGVKRGKGIAPNIYVYDNPDDPGSKALKVAEKTVAGEIK